MLFCWWSRPIDRAGRAERTPLDSLAQLYREVDGQFLATFAELDPYECREAEEYWGVWQYANGQPIKWPPGRGLKLFAYIKAFPAAQQLLHAIAQRGIPMVVARLEKWALPGALPSGSVQFVDGPVDMAQACSECDIAILNGTHGSSAAALLAGKPSLQLPLFLEQGLTAERIHAMGAGRLASVHDPKAIFDALDA